MQKETALKISKIDVVLVLLCLIAISFCLITGYLAMTSTGAQ